MKLAHLRNLTVEDVIDTLPMREGVALSGFFHFVLIVIFYTGLPNFFTKHYDHIALTVPVEVVSISEVSNLPPLKKPRVPPSKPHQRITAPAPPTKPDRPTKEAVTIEPLPNPLAPKEIKKDISRQELPKPAPKKSTPQAVDTFESVLKTVEALKDHPPTPAPTPPTTYDPDQPLSMTVIQAIQKTIEKCWAIPAGARNAEDLIIEIDVVLNPDGMVRSARLLNAGRARRDPFYRTASESALRAVYDPRCNPLPVPKDEYEKWKNITLRFNPREMLGL